MLAKLTSKNQLTLPKSVTDSLGPVQYFEVQVQSGQVVLTPVRIQRGDAVRAKLAELDLGDDVFAQALAWATEGPASGVSTKTKSVRKAASRAPARKSGGASESPASAEARKSTRASARAAGKPAKVAEAVKAVKAAKATAGSGRSVKAAATVKAAKPPKSSGAAETGPVRRRRSA